jgi:hypothetical protein
MYEETQRCDEETEVCDEETQRCDEEIQRIAMKKHRGTSTN